MMITTPSAPGGAAAAQSALPGGAMDAALPASSSAMEGVEGTGIPVPFAELLHLSGLALPADPAAAQAAPQPASAETDSDTPAGEARVEPALAAMMPVLHFAMQPAVQAPAAAADQPQAATSAMATAAASASARQAAADAITAASSAAAMPLAARLLQGVPPAPGEAAAPKAPADTRQAAATLSLHAGNGTAAQPAAAAVTMPATQDGSKQSGQDGQPQGDNGASFRGVLAAAVPAANANAAADTLKLVGNPEQWQQPLRAALGDRLQLTLQKGNDQAVNQAVIRLEPPNLGSIEISIRQSAGALHVSMSATNSEVVRQLNAVGDSMRQDLSQRQQGDVAVTVSQASSRSLADSEGRGRQPEREAEQQREQRGPGRALNEGDDTNTTFAMLRE